MSENNIDEKLIPGHEYDGIRELDNPLPGWWLTTFYGTIIFAVGYYIAYTFLGAPTQAQELKEAMAQIATLQGPSDKLPTEQELNAKFNAQTLSDGKAVFVARCVACHGDKGQGIVGPNLTDAYWIHGKGTRADIYKVIHNGVPDKGMLAWGEILKPEEVLAVTSFVYSIRNTNVPGKPPQGDKVE